MAGEGGILEFADRATQAVKNNFAAWREASPKHNQLVDAMLGAPLHIIALSQPSGVRRLGHPSTAPTLPKDTQASATRARAIVTDIERGLGFDPIDRELEKLGYDIESRIPGTGRLRFIEVKGRVTGAETITVTKNEVLYSLNKPDDYILAIVEFLDENTHRVHSVRRPFQREPDFRVTDLNYSFAQLLELAEEPR
ncbi:protein NO VEIN domain-containing protein [Desulfonatronum parangueonense]